MLDDCDAATTAALRLLLKHYDARYPSAASLVPLPCPRSLCKWSTQEWLVQHLIAPERRRLLCDSELGATEWRKVFWKRVVAAIEQGINESEEPDVRRAR